MAASTRDEESFDRFLDLLCLTGREEYPRQDQQQGRADNDGRDFHEASAMLNGEVRPVKPRLQRNDGKLRIEEIRSGSRRERGSAVSYVSTPLTTFARASPRTAARAIRAEVERISILDSTLQKAA